MIEKKTRAFLVMAIGDKYKYLLDKSSLMLEWYASKCNADLIVIDTPPDKSMKHSILVQKVLLPSLCKSYTTVCALDLDIIVSPNAKDIFDSVGELNGVAAALDPRDTEEYKLTAIRLWKRSKVDKFDYISDYTRSGLNPHQNLIGTINAGVWLFNPSMITDLFENLYFSEFYDKLIKNRNFLLSKGISIGDYDEAIIGYETQVRNLFKPLSLSFNTQLIYSLYGTDLFYDIPGLNQSFTWRLLCKILKGTSLNDRFSNNSYKYNKNYINLIKKLLAEVDIIHFSGGYHIPDEFLKNELYS